MEWRAAALVMIAACGGGLPARPDVADGSADVAEAGAPYSEAEHAAFPISVSTGGTVLQAPTVIPVFYAEDIAARNTAEALLAKLPTSDYWAQLEKEYGVGPLTVASSVVLDVSPPAAMTADDVSSLIASKLNAHDASWPPADPNNIYFIYFPSETTLDLNGSAGCTDFLGYHDHGLAEPDTRFVFAVQARCPNVPLIDGVTQNTTHELVEAATDPYYDAYSIVDDAHAVWNYFPTGEIGDMCEYESLSYQRDVGDSLVARFWSNSAGQAGHDPCVPAIAAPYYNSVPVLPDALQLIFNGKEIDTTGIRVPQGTSKTIDVQLFSDGPTDDWTVSAADASYLYGTGTPDLTFTWSKSVGNNGDVFELTIKRIQSTYANGTEFVIYSQKSSTDFHEYFAFAGL